MFLNRLAHRAWLSTRRRGVLGALAALQRSEWSSGEEIRRHQDLRLGALLAHSAARVPFYRDLFGRLGVDPRAAAPREILAALPPLSRESLRARRSELASEDAARRGAYESATGGSTGTPLTFLQDPEHWRRNQAAMYRGFLWCGWEIGDPLAYLWGSDVDSRHHRGKGALRDALLGVKWLNAFSVTAEDMDRFLEQLDQSGRVLLVGYASSLALLARHALRRGGGPRLRAVESSAEVLMPEVRRDIASAFGCAVLDRYGCREAGVIAHECGSGSGWHVNAENVIVETDPEGRLLVTLLTNYSMPLIRYRNDDLVDAGGGGCPCGRQLPLIAKVIGRRSDLVLSPSGRSIHGEFFTHLFYGQGNVREFQVIQRSRSELLIRIAPPGALSAPEMAKMENAIRSHGDPGFVISWEQIPGIPRAASGKYRFVISEIAARESEPQTARGGGAP